MRLLSALWLFYRKLIIPSLAVAVLLSILMSGFVKLFTGVGISFIFITPAFHYILYDLGNTTEYYFYYNLGLSKLVLWVNTIAVSLLAGLLIAAV